MVQKVIIIHPVNQFTFPNLGTQDTNKNYEIT